MIEKQSNDLNSFKIKFNLFIVLLFVYVALFEFVLPVNKIMPKPSLLAESFFTVWSDYNLLEAASLTSTVIYLSLIIGYILIHLFSQIIFKFTFEFGGSFEAFKLFRYFPAFFFAIIFVYWFHDSFWAELVFALFISIYMLKLKIFSEAINTKEVYVTAARNMGLSENEIYSQVIKKAIQPKVFKELLTIHNYLWVIILIYEFVTQHNGFGGAYYQSLVYNDFTALFTFALIISLLVWFGNSVISFISQKVFNWEA